MIRGKLSEVETKDSSVTYQKRKRANVEQWKKSCKKKQKKGAKYLPEIKMVKLNSREDKIYSVPAWGGDLVYEGTKIKLTNTCSIDNLLRMLYHSMDYTSLGQPQQPICRLLRDLKPDMNSGKWVCVRVRWLLHFGMFVLHKHEKNFLWSLFGSEYTSVKRHLTSLQESMQISDCSKED